MILVSLNKGPLGLLLIAKSSTDTSSPCVLTVFS